MPVTNGTVPALNGIRLGISINFMIFLQEVMQNTALAVRVADESIKNALDYVVLRQDLFKSEEEKQRIGNFLVQLKKTGVQAMLRKDRDGTIESV